MRVLKFDGSNEQHVSTFNLLVMAWNYEDERKLPLVSVGNTPERIELACEINKAFRHGLMQLSAKEFTLRPEGTEIRVRETGHALVKEFWEAYRRLLPTRYAEQMVAVDAFLRDAPAVSDHEQPQKNGKHGAKNRIVAHG